MKKSIVTLLVAILAVSSVATYALQITDSATAIKKEATNAIKSGNYNEIVDLLAQLGSAGDKQRNVILNAIQSALNTATLKSKAPAAVTAFNAVSGVTITKAAGGKYSIKYVSEDTTTGSVAKEDIPKAAVEQPTLSTNPLVNKR
jgi:hypothetical protein